VHVPTLEENIMSKLSTRLAALASSPKAKAALDKVREQAAKPENRRRIEQLKARLKGGGAGAPPR
jgi:hypothetical protein